MLRTNSQAGAELPGNGIKIEIGEDFYESGKSSAKLTEKEL